MLRILRQNSILTHKLLIIVVLTSSFISLFTTLSQMAWEYHTEKDKLDNILLLIEDSYADPLAKSIWEFNLPQTQSLLDGIFTLPNVMHVRLSASDEVYERGEPIDSQSITTSFDINYTEAVDGGVRNIGKIEVTASLEAMYKLLLSRILFVLLSNLLKTFLVSFCILILFHRIVTRHLLAMTSFFAQYEDKYDQLCLKRTQEPLSRKKDELDFLAETINNSAQRLDLSRKKLKLELTRRIEAENRLKALNLDLEEKVDERSQELVKTKESLEHATKMAALGEMAGGIAHEINNPAAIICGSSQLVKKILARQDHQIEHSPKVNKLLDQIFDTSIRISKIVKSMLQFARENPEDAVYESVTIDEILNNSALFLGDRCKQSGVQLIEECDRAIKLECHLISISQILTNLVGNAIDAIEGSDKPWIKLRSESTNEFVTITITDSGSGIPKNVVDKMLQPFFTTKEIGKGTGLGLSLSKGIAEQHGGTLTYALDHGHTSFALRLPIIHPQKEDNVAD